MSRTAKPPVVRSCRSCWKTFTVAHPPSWTAAGVRAAPIVRVSRSARRGKPHVPIGENAGVGATRLVFARDAAAAARFYREAFGIELGQDVAFGVDDLEGAHARAVEAGAEVVQEPEDGRAAYKDPEGNVVTLAERPRAVSVAGVDMAGGGWAVVVLEGDLVAEAFRSETFAEALLVDAEVVAVDIPIGIPESTPRPADVEARRFVGARGSSV